MRVLRNVIGAALILGGVSAANAQTTSSEAENYQAPGPITIYSIGSPAGYYMQWSNFLGEIAPDFMGQPVSEVQNIAEPIELLDRLSRRPTDGTTWGCMSSQYWGRILIRNPYSWDVSGLQVLGGVMGPPEAVWAGTGTGWDSWDDVVNSGRQVRIGALTIPMLISKALTDAGVDFVLVRMNLSEAMQAIVAGDIDLFTIAATETSLAPYNDGIWNPLLVVAEERSEHLPDTPTHTEVGWPADWAATRVARICFVPPGTDEATLADMRAAFNRMLEDQRHSEFHESKQSPSEVLTAEQIRAQVDGDVAVNLTFPEEMLEQYLFD